MDAELALSEPVGEYLRRNYKFQPIWCIVGADVLTCRFGRCFCFAEVSTGHPHLGSPLVFLIILFRALRSSPPTTQLIGYIYNCNAVPTFCTLRFAFCIYPDQLQIINIIEKFLLTTQGKSDNILFGNSV